MNRWMKIAYDEASAGMLADNGGPFGAVIVKNKDLIMEQIEHKEGAELFDRWIEKENHQIY